MLSSSIPGINPDGFMVNKPDFSSQGYDKPESSSFSKLINDADRFGDDNTLTSTDVKTEENTPESGQKESATESTHDTNDVKTDQQASHNDKGQDGNDTEESKSDVETGKGADSEDTQSDMADNDNELDATDGDQVLTGENTIIIPDGKTVHDSAGEIISEIITDSAKSAINNNGTVTEELNTATVIASDKSQNKATNENTDINKETNGDIKEALLDEISVEESDAENGEFENNESKHDPSDKNAAAGNSDTDEQAEDSGLNKNTAKHINIDTDRELPDRYAKKTVIDQADMSRIQQQMNNMDPEALEELRNFKPLQETLFFNNMQGISNAPGIRSSLSNLSDSSVNSLESFNSNTAVNNAEVAQNQAMTMANSKSGLGLSQSNAARTAGFSELLNQVVYVAKGKSKLGVTVNHEEFGKLRINVSMEKGILNVHVHASEKVVKEFLESNIQNIIEHLDKDGVSVGGFSVALKDQKNDPEKKFLMDSGFERNYDLKPAPVYSNQGLINVFA